MGISVKELRIGNHVLFNNADITVTYHHIRIQSLADAHIDSSMTNKEFIGYKPIPLTEEWLLKLGFIKLNNRHEFVHGENEPNMSICYEDNYFIFFVEDEISYNTIRKELKYVHTLQNFFFALKGEELTIKETAHESL